MREIKCKMVIKFQNKKNKKSFSKKACVFFKI